MTWKERSHVDERVQLLGEYLKGERAMAELCREFGVSRKTAYKWLVRYSSARPVRDFDSRDAILATPPEGGDRRPPRFVDISRGPNSRSARGKSALRRKDVRERPRSLHDSRRPPIRRHGAARSSRGRLGTRRDPGCSSF
jgi:transposase-like protein